MNGNLLAMAVVLFVMKWFLVTLVLLASGCTASAATLATPQVTPPPTALPMPLGNRSIYVIDTHNGDLVSEILFIDPDAGRRISGLGTRYNPEIAFSPDGRRLYVADSYNTKVIRGEHHDVVSVYDAATGQLIHDDVDIPIRLQYKVFPLTHPFTFLSRDGQRLFVGKYGEPDIHATRLAVLDANTFNTLAEYPQPLCNLLPLRDGRLLCAGQSQPQLVDPLTGRATQISASVPALTASVVASSRDWVYLVGFDAAASTLVTVIDLSTSPARMVAERIPLSAPSNSRAGLNHVAINSDESRLYIGFLHSTGELVGRGLAAEIWAFDTRTWARVGIFTPTDPAFHVAVSADGTQLYTVNPFKNSLTIFDTTTFREVTVMRDLGKTPAQVVIPPSSR